MRWQFVSFSLEGRNKKIFTPHLPLPPFPKKKILALPITCPIISLAFRNLCFSLICDHFLPRLMVMVGGMGV